MKIKIRVKWSPHPAYPWKPWRASFGFASCLGETPMAAVKNMTRKLHYLRNQRPAVLENVIGSEKRKRLKTETDREQRSPGKQ